jgi:hypothetical protein
MNFEGSNYCRTCGKKLKNALVSSIVGVAAVGGYEGIPFAPTSIVGEDFQSMADEGARSEEAQASERRAVDFAPP